MYQLHRTMYEFFPIGVTDDYTMATHLHAGRCLALATVKPQCVPIVVEVRGFQSCTEIFQESIECPIISQRYRDCFDMEAEAEQSNLAIIMSKVILHGNSSMH